MVISELKSLRGIDLTGMLFGNLTVVGKGERAKQGQTRWDCLCFCGNKTLVVGKDLKKGHSTSCGCLKIDKLVKRSVTHGARHSTEYKSWCEMKYRCLNPSCKLYKYYGGRGIRVCERWLNSFENFLFDMGLKPSPLHTLDRFPNKNGDYEPENCRWASKKEQANNTRRNVIFEYNGVSKNIMEWASVLNVKYHTLYFLIKRRGFEKAFLYYKEKKKKAIWAYEKS